MTSTRSSLTPASVQAALVQIALLAADSTYWKKDTSAFGSGAGAGFLILTPVGGNQPDMQIVFCFGPHLSMMLSPHTTDANTIFMGLCPDGGAASSPLLAAGPCASSGERFTKYLRVTGSLSSVAGKTDTLFALSSDESFGIWFRQDATPNWHGGIAGAIVDPPTNADGEGTPGRIYGMAVTGNVKLSGTFWGQTTGFFQSAGANQGSFQCFDPNATTTMIEMDRNTITMPTSPRYLTQFGTQVSMPFAVFEEASPYNLIGIPRQMRMTTDGQMRQIVQTAAGVTKSYYIAGSALTTDAVSFDNG
jgi:hypothetical protein